jgi:translation initiation factor IF-3
VKTLRGTACHSPPLHQLIIHLSILVICFTDYTDRPFKLKTCCAAVGRRAGIPLKRLDNLSKAAKVFTIARLVQRTTLAWGTNRLEREGLGIAAEKEDRRNFEITAPRVRVIGSDGSQIGIMLTRDAVAKAEEEGLELVEISPNAEPPVCKIMDYGKYLYQKDKAQHAAKRKQKIIQVKEIKFRPTTEDGDYNTKLRQIRGFLEDGDKVKITIRFRGRELAHQELGMQLMERLRTDVDELGSVEQFPKMEGKQAVMVMGAKRK